MASYWFDPDHGTFVHGSILPLTQATIESAAVLF